MSFIERANRIASTSIKEWRKKGSGKHKGRHRDHREAYSPYADENTPTNSRDFSGRTLTRAAHFSTMNVLEPLSRRHRSASMANLDSSDRHLPPSDDQSDFDVHSSVYDDNSTNDSGAVVSRKSLLQRQVSLDDSDLSRSSASASKEATCDSSDRLRDSRKRMRNRPIPQIQINSVSELSDGGISAAISDKNGSFPWTTTSSVDALPRQGFFWQMHLYLRLARGLPARNVSGKVDAYVKVKYRGKSFARSKIIGNNPDPVWDDRFLFPFTNLNYPIELRVYNRDVFKKDDYIGRARVYPTKLSFGLEQEFHIPLEDETGRSVQQYLGELRFWMTLGEMSEMDVPSDRRRAMLKQINEDRQASGRLTPMLSRAPSDISSRYDSTMSLMNRAETMRQNWAESVQNLSHDLSFEQTMSSIDEYEPESDEWLLPNAASFHQPQWPLTFYDGTKVELYTTAAGDKSQSVSVSQLSSAKYGRNEARLERFYNQTRLLVNLIRGEELGVPVYAKVSDAGLSMSRLNVPKSKLLTNRSMERAIVGGPMSHTDETIPSYQATLSIGKHSRKSHTVRSNTAPCWHEHFEFRLRLGEKAVLNVEIIDYGLPVPVVLFRGYLDFERQIPDWTGCFTLKNNIEGYRGNVTLLVTLTGLTLCPDLASVSPPSSGPDQERSPVYNMSCSPPPTPGLSPLSKDLLRMVEAHYSLQRTFENRKDVGWLHVVVRRAQRLASEDRSAKVNPYCVIRLVNRCVHTSTIYKTVNPIWNEAFVFPISDIYDVMEITVLGEDKKGSDVLGCLCFPVIQLANHRSRWYALKHKTMKKAAKGAILLDSYMTYNPVRAAIRVIYPKETSWVLATERVHLRDLIKKYVPQLQQKIDRISPYGVYLTKGHKVFMQLYNWENWVLSSLALVGICLGILFVQPYMIPGGMMVGFAACWVLRMDWFRSRARYTLSVTPTPESDEDDYEEFPYTEQELLEQDSDTEIDEPQEKRKRGRKKPLKVKLAKTRQVLGTIQTIFESVASVLEKIDCLIKWQVPWLSLLFFLYLLMVTVLAFCIPTRYLLAFFTAKQFTKRLRNANIYDASPFSIVSRVPNKQQRLSYRELRPKAVNSFAN